jgi:hypothetical protein
MFLFITVADHPWDHGSHGTPKFSIYIRPGLILTLDFSWRSGNEVCFSFGGRVFDPSIFFLFIFLLYFYYFVKKRLLWGIRTRTPYSAFKGNKPLNELTILIFSSNSLIYISYNFGTPKKITLDPPLLHNPSLF